MPLGRLIASSARECLGEDPEVDDLVKVHEAPVGELAGFAAAAELIDEELEGACAFTEVVRFGDAVEAMEGEGDEAPLEDGLSDEAFGVRGHGHGGSRVVGAGGATRGECKRKKPTIPKNRGLRVEINPGSDLLSHRPAPAVPSAVEGLTSVFGMGTGVTLLL